MGLFSFLRRDRNATNDMAPRGRRAGDLPSADVVRTQARRRLIGAAVLVMVAVLVLPWVFDSKPRPLPVNIPIEVPKRDLTVALPEPPSARRDDPAAAAPAQAVTAAPTASVASLPPAAPIASAASTSPADAPPAPPAPKADTARTPEVPKKVDDHKPKAPPAEAPVKATPKPEAKPAKAPTPDVPAKPAAEAERARAALEGRAPAPAPALATTRFIVQVGAFEQADGAKEARQRVAKAGLQAHETTVQTAEGKRIRVRVGPFPSREAADAAAAKLRAAGIAGAVMPQ